MNQEEVNYEHKKTKYFIVFFTLIYLVLLPFVSGMALFSPMVFDKPSMTESVGLTIIALLIALPVIMLTCMLSMWLKYLDGEYKKARFRAILPSISIAICFILNILLLELFL